MIAGLLLACASQQALALTQHEKLWLGLNHQAHFGDHNQWLAAIFTQLRFINESHPLQAGLIEGGLGYRLAPGKSIWAGYRWSGHEPYNKFYQENRLFQQLLLPIRAKIDRSIFRSRVEEIERTNQPQILIRLRERIALEFDDKIISCVHPFIYDEVFLNLNKTTYSTNRFISENRVFIGVNWSVNKTDWWELGYINQYVMAVSPSAPNQMDHIASITYNYF